MLGAVVPGVAAAPCAEPGVVLPQPGGGCGLGGSFGEGQGGRGGGCGLCPLPALSPPSFPRPLLGRAGWANRGGAPFGAFAASPGRRRRRKSLARPGLCPAAGGVVGGVEAGRET